MSYAVVEFPRFGAARPDVEEVMEKDESLRQWSGVTSVQDTDWLVEALDVIADIEKLAENWDSYGAVTPKKAAVRGARLLLSKLDFKNIPVPNIVAAPNGAVGLHWRVDDKDLELIVSSEDHIEFLETTIAQNSKMFDGVVTSSSAQSTIDWLTEA